jgi:hypothetical protein
MLIELLQNYKPFQEYTRDKQAVFQKLANTFEQQTDFLFDQPELIHRKTNLATPDTWKEFLELEPTNQYIKSQMQFLGQIAQRQSFRSLLTMALEGNAQAARQIQELTAEKAQDNKTKIILHQIPRPQSEQNLSKDE